MRPKVSTAALLLAPVLVGLTASAALLVDYVRSSPVFCADGGGCDAVKHTVIASPFGVPMPAFGVLGFAVLAILSLSPGPRVRTAQRIVAIAAAIVGAGLIAVQVLLGQLCAYCLAVDLSACVACGAAIGRARAGWDLPGSRALRGALAVALGAVPAIVLLLGFTAKIPLPSVIAEELGRAPKGQATVVEFVDFECPFCRDEYDHIEPLLEATKDRVRVVRKLVPLTRIHPHALDAARAACCADRLGKGDAMADALFHAPVEELTPEGCEKIASSLGLDLAAYAACVADPTTTDRLASDRDVFDKAALKGDGLPLLWIGEKKVMGLREAAELREALDEAIAKAGS
jgi:protein-disulfide isomerase